ncbi:Erythroid Membrane-Associated Protein [Manis pentadactyla]|nr:Erythroid Membrane-Associated Protein [Manis pentadactyla]
MYKVYFTLKQERNFSNELQCSATTICRAPRCQAELKCPFDDIQGTIVSFFNLTCLRSRYKFPGKVLGPVLGFGALLS